MTENKNLGVTLVTGASSGIGRAVAQRFLAAGERVIGLDVLPSSIRHEAYKHYVCDVSDPLALPDLDEAVEVLVNNAGVQNGNDIAVNLLGTYNVTEKYGVQSRIKAVVMIASASAHTGAEFPLYSASKGGVLAYAKNVALRIAAYGATCNSLSPGGVTTDLNKQVMQDKEKWAEIMSLTPLKKWATPEEIAEFVYFVARVNRSMTGQDIVIDNGEMTDAKFVW